MKKRLADTFNYYWQVTKDFCVHTILHADDPPHRLALGIAIAMFVTFTPTIGFQMGLVVVLAWLLGANKLVGVPLVWLSNPATLVPIYYPCYWVGRKILGLDGVDAQWWNDFSHPPAGFQPRVSHFWHKFTDVAAPLWLGSLVIGLSMAVISYYASLHVIRSYRMRRWGQLMPPSHELPTPSQNDDDSDGNPPGGDSSESLASVTRPQSSPGSSGPKAFNSVGKSGSTSPAA